MSAQPQYNGNGQQQYGQTQQPQAVQVDNHMLLYICAFFFPPIAVFLQTGLVGPETLITLLLSCLFWFPGIIYAFIIINRAQAAGIPPKINLMAPQPQQQQQQPQEYNQKPMQTV